MCGTKLWVGKQDDSTTPQSIYSMHRWQSFQRRNEICWRIVTCMLSNCSGMLFLGTYWTTWYSMVSEQTCTIDYKMDQSLWQTTESLDILYPPNMWNTDNIVMWEILLSNADWDCFKTLTSREILRIQNLLREEHSAFLEVIHLFRRVGCVRNKLQFRTVHQNQRSFLWMQDWGWTVYPHLILWDLIVAVLGNTNQNKYRETRFNLQRERKFMERLMI